MASYAAGLPVEVYLEHVAVGAALPEMPLFLRPDRYVNVPLEPTYQAAYRGLIWGSEFLLNSENRQQNVESATAGQRVVNLATSHERPTQSQRVDR